MKEAMSLDEIIELLKTLGCTVGLQKCEESQKIWLVYLCKVAAAIVGC